jgi:hypothetical protein
MKVALQSEVDKITQATSFGSTKYDVQPGALPALSYNRHQSLEK